MEKQIKAARAEVNKYKFGTSEWEDAMEIVRKLVADHDAKQPKFVHTSIDGDVWSV